MVISEAELHPKPAGSPLSEETRRRAHHALTECGYVYLDNFFPAHRIHAFRKAYERFRVKPEAKAFEYPCQGEGRREHMLPFQSPFNDSGVYSDSRLLTLLNDFLGDEIKMELMTVITSPPGSKHQRWHQGERRPLAHALACELLSNSASKRQRPVSRVAYTRRVRVRVSRVTRTRC